MEARSDYPVAPQELPGEEVATRGRLIMESETSIALVIANYGELGLSPEDQIAVLNIVIDGIKNRSR